MKTKIKAALYSLLTVGVVSAFLYVLTIVPTWVTFCVCVLALLFFIFVFWYNHLEDKED